MNEQSEREAIVAWPRARPKQETAPAEARVIEAHYDEHGNWWPRREQAMSRLIGPHDYADAIERGDHLKGKSDER